MKTLLVLLASTLTLVVASHQQWPKPLDLNEIRKAWRKTVEPHMNSCMCKSGAKMDLINGFFDRGEVSDDPCFKCNLRCWAQSLEVMGSSGILDAKMLEQKAAGVDGPIANKCAGVPGVDLCDRAHNLVMCVVRILGGLDPYPGPPNSVKVSSKVWAPYK